ncbi:MAG: hypothetical protein NC818_05985 [Candidatus Omnitrophica bacterium]|nr:hypothetical protein [Candidatus Omnitrophota bacterium]
MVGSRKFKVLLVAIISFLMTANQLFARRLQTPHAPFMEKLLKSLEEDTPVEEAIQPDFFAKNWESLDVGIRIGFRENTFLEIRESKGEVLVMQLFGMLTAEDKANLRIIEENIEEECNNKYRDNIPAIVFLDVSGKIMERKEIEGVYSILSLPAEDFALFIKDIRSGGINALPIEIVEIIDECTDTLERYIKYGLIDISSLPTNRKEFIELLHEAIEEMERDIVQDKEILEVIEEDIFSVIDLFLGEYGEIIFRNFYREVLEPCNHSLKSQYTLRDLATNGFAQISQTVLKHGILIELSPSAFIEFRLSDDTGIVNVVGTSLKGGLPSLGMVIEKFFKLCEEKGLDVHILHGAMVSSIEPLRDAFGITHLSEGEFSLLVKDIKAGGNASGYFGVGEKLIDFVAAMYDDLINYEFERLGLNVEDLFMNKIKLSAYIEAIIRAYEVLITKYKAEVDIIISGEKISHEEIERRINRYKEYLKSLFTGKGNIIYRIFYRDFLRTDPLVIRIIKSETD